MSRDYRYGWTGPQPSGDDEQVANANPDFVDLSPVTEEPANRTRANWSALLPNNVPVIWEFDR